jgi:acylphosphatase
VKKVKARAHVYVNGLVQGVYFRSSTRELAYDLGVKGWVRNLPDGRVEAVFEGEEEMVRRLVDFCRRGPPRSRVSNVDVAWEKFTGEFMYFGLG